MTDRMKNLMIGLFVMGAVTITTWLILFLKPSVGDGKKTLHVRFTNISGISVGTRVNYAGKPVGEVVKVLEISDARQHPDAQGDIYVYELTLKIDSSVEVYSSDEIAIKTTGLLGEKSIAILPQLAPKNTTAYLITNQTLYADSTDALENTFHQVAQVANRLEIAIERVDLWFEQNQIYLTDALRSFGGAMGQMQTMLSSLNEEKIAFALRHSLDLLSENLQLIKEGLDDDQLLHKYAHLADSLDQVAQSFQTDGAEALHNINQITRDIASGSGTLGRLVAGDDLYLRVISLMNKGETLMNDINHYGILFQYNKQWQKARTRKATFLKALDTPQEFRNYFEGEIDSMTTSLGRLTELIDRANSQERICILQSDAFKKDFASLLRQVQSLTDSLKLYNEAVIALSETKDCEETNSP